MRSIIKLIQSLDDPNLYKFYDTDCCLVKNNNFYTVYDEGFEQQYLTFAIDTPLETIEIAFTYWLTGYKDGYKNGEDMGKFRLQSEFKKLFEIK